MAVREISSEEFYQLSRRTDGKLLVVKFTATWCGPCQRVAPQYEALAQRNPDVEFTKVYEHNSRDAIINSGVRSFPTFRFYCNGGQIDECRGAAIQNVNERVQRHKGSARAAGPVSVKLRFDRERPRRDGGGSIRVSEEAEVEVHASEGLEIFKFQVLSVTDIEAEDQTLFAGDSSASITNDDGLKAALGTTGGGLYGNYPVIRVTKRVRDDAILARKIGVSTEATSAALASAPTAVAAPVPAAVPVPAAAAGLAAAAAKTAAASPRAASAAGISERSRWDGCCSRTFFGMRPMIQPAYVLREEALLPDEDLTEHQKKKAGPEDILVVCRHCAENCFGGGVAELCPAISESVAYICQSEEALDRGYGVDLLSRRVGAEAEMYEPGSTVATAAETAAAVAAEQAYYSVRGASAAMGESAEMAAMRGRIMSGVQGVLGYEDPELQAKARAVLSPPGTDEMGSVHQRAREWADSKECSQEEGLAHVLLSWFKKEFFKWVNKPPCSACGARGADLGIKGMGRPTPEEAASRASRVEVYACTPCGSLTRFPRYNDPAKLLETRSGRCGEWANCFTLICRAVGLEARHVIDWTDHVWTEIWIPAKNRWMHADPCENKLDRPLMYEAGWNKRLSYVLAFDRDSSVDVTRRYTSRWVEVLSRRKLVPEKWLAGVLARTGSSHPAARTALISARLEKEQRELEGYGLTARGEDPDVDRDEKEGRISGDAEWIASRGEDGVSTPSETPSNFSQVNSSLVGTPLGQLQPGGGLALCVATVVEGPMEASVLVGGVTVCRLSGNTQGALCAGAVCSMTGLLLDARTFSMQNSEETSTLTAELPEWLDGLPDDVVVAVACSSGKASGSTAALAEELEGTLGNFVHGSQANAAGGSAAREGKVVTGYGWTLVGWKGADVPEWARRQDHPAGCGKRSALYVELLFSPPALPSGESSTPVAPALEERKVELENKMCLTPLRSLPARAEAGAEVSAPELPPEAIEFPARGMCHRAGEPTVSIGPIVDLVDCPGWTTVLSAPKDRLEAGMADDGGGKASPSAVWRVTTVAPAVGAWRPHTKPFDGTADGCPSAVVGSSPLPPRNGASLLLPVARVRDIIVWSGLGINGVQVVYDVGGEVVFGVKEMGSFGSYRQSKLTLDVEGGEAVIEISVKTRRRIVESLAIKTSKGQEMKWGGEGVQAHGHTWSVPSGSSFLGFHGGRGDHLQYLGVIFAEQGGLMGIGEGTSNSSLYTGAAAPGVNMARSWSLAVKVGLHSTSPVLRACAQLVAFNTTSAAESSASEEILTVLRTALKYVGNLLDNPQDKRMSQIRLANGFFDRKIGKVSGGGGVMRSMGFELTDDGGRMHYVFRKQGVRGGLDRVRYARRALENFLAHLEPSNYQAF